MRVLFVSNTTVGGSGRSQRELATRLRGLGHEVEFLVDGAEPARLRRWAYGHLSDLAVRITDRMGSRLVMTLEGVPGRRARHTSVGGLQHRMTPIPENAAPFVLRSFRPDVVIGNSILRLTWKKIRAMCEQQSITTVLYIREVETLNHFEPEVRPADGVVANAASLARQVEALGFPCAVFPSVIETDVTAVESSRRVALVINPIESRGIGTIWTLAATLPNIPFVVQESWPLEPAQLKRVQERAAELPNVEFRRAEPAGPRLYRDARVLLVPYRIDNRPRVIPEAQANGIPVIVADSPALVEAAGDGGIVVEVDDLPAWRDAIRSIWSDEARYATLVARALAHSRRDDIDACAVAERFDQFLRELTATSRA